MLLLVALAAVGAAAHPLVPIRETDPDRAGPLAHQAFRAAFGRGPRTPIVREGRTYDFTPVTAVALAGGRTALISTGALRDAGHAEDGLNAIHYLVRVRSRLRVTGHWFGLGAGGSHGVSATQWAVTRSLSRWPVLYTEGGGTWQGCTVSVATLTELRPTGPVDVAFFPVAFDNGGMVEGPRAQEISGVIVAAVPDRSFTVRYSGSMRFSETYARMGERYRLSGRRASRMPGC
jgi:hypothetical protein